MREKSFIVLGDLIKLSNNIALFDSYVLKRPTLEQHHYIKFQIDKYNNLFNMGASRYEYELKHKEKGEIETVPIPPEEWKYSIIEYDNIQIDQKSDFILILNLSEIDFNVLFEVTYAYSVKSSDGRNVPGILSNISPLAQLNFFIDNPFFQIEEKEISESSINELKAIVSTLKDYRLSFSSEYINKALIDFLKLKEISKSSPFKVLGYFSILELLLTNYQGRENPLSYQLSRKINLVNNQLSEKVDFRKYFQAPDTTTLETVVEILYKYRNDIAHGNIIDFENKFKQIKDKNQVVAFLHNLVRKILIKSISDPRLILDLKFC